MIRRLILLILSLLIITSCSSTSKMTGTDRPLSGRNITVDPGHGDTNLYDNFRIGPSGEREEWINLRVAKILTKKLRAAGANVLLTRSQDKDVSLGGRATLANLHGSELLVSIHHNGSANDPNIDLPIVYFYGDASLNPASVDFANILLAKMRDKLKFEQPNAGAVYSDHLIYSSGTSILRNTIHNMPGVIGEAGFFTNPKGEKRLRSKAYNELEAQVYFDAIVNYFEKGIPTVEALVSDTVIFIGLDQELQFQLNDGRGGNSFDEASLLVLQDGDTLSSHWNAETGVLSVQAIASDEKRVSFQVFGRNSNGNAMHPAPISFLTEQGASWYASEKWFDAFEKAEDSFARLDVIDATATDERLLILNNALNFYQLSLELQAVHPKARQTEKRILELLKLKQELTEEDLSEEIKDQTRRIIEFYP